MRYFDKDDVKSIKVQFDKIADVKKFVDEANEFLDKVTIANTDNYICDGHSIMGIFGLNLSEPVTVTCHTTEFNKLCKICDYLNITV